MASTWAVPRTTQFVVTMSNRHRHPFGLDASLWTEGGERGERLETERERLAGDEIPGRGEQWEAVLAEVRDWRRTLERNS
ncbi:hypothetical protein [Natrinema sp. HArc-T2]|uniref:hypothetical protein n=1 Tax=Natrinema sp. HArc-T2 TaxID=3242701 RepID=UPI00359E63BA